MSLVSKTIKCDWPGCGKQATYQHTLPDRWRAELGGTHHLCPEHRHATWEDLDVACWAAVGVEVREG